MIWLWILGGLCLLALLILLVGGSYLLFRFAVVRRRRRPAMADAPAPENDRSVWAAWRPVIEEGKAWFLAQGPEQVEITSFDGLKLTGFYLPCPGSKRTVLCFHGYRSDGWADFACVLKFYHEQGCNLLVAHQRAHGLSEGKYICFGVKERFDCRDWAGYLAGRFPGHALFLHGLSMGGATVLMAAGLDLPPQVKGVISDCGFTSPYDIMKHVAKNLHIPTFPFLPLTRIWIRLIAGFGLKEAGTLEALKKTRLPVLFIHGTSDDFVPVWMTEKNFEACASEKHLLLVEGAGHALSYLTDPASCEKAVTEFLQAHAA